ncbi:MAG: methyl-accepting chemotaxis protein [Oligoflexia bacterium]|nr:methyl-accepting chemotaxis protein [Oligoflexia bacterium]
MATYRRRIFLIDKKFQFRIALYVCAWVVALGFVHPLVVHSLFEIFIGFAAATPNGPELELLHQTRNEVLTLMSLTELVFVGLTFFSSLFLAHRIAGPIYKLRKLMGQAKAGDYSEQLRFRKYDHFQYLATDYNELVANFRARTQQAAQGIEKAMASATPEGRRELEKALSALLPAPPQT